jgi:dTDP-4-amino-4,6-dideoxygalactose transaminase
MHAYQTFATRLAPDLDRGAVRAALAAAGIESGPATYAFHRLPSHAGIARPVPLAESDALHERSLALPLYLGMRSAELDRVCDALTKAIST